MKTKINLGKAAKKTAMAILLVSGMTMISCSHDMCVAYSTPLERAQYIKTRNHGNGAYNITSPYTARYKAKMQKRYFGNI